MWHSAPWHGGQAQSSEGVDWDSHAAFALRSQSDGSCPCDFGLHHAVGAEDRDRLPHCLAPQLVLQCLLEGRCIADTMTALRHLEYSQHGRECDPPTPREEGQEHPTCPGPAAVTLRSLSPHPRCHWQPPSLGAQCFLVIYGAPISSRTRGGEPEIIYFVLSLSFKGKSNALGKGINVCPMWIS